jgi:DNA modification methylase
MNYQDFLRSKHLRVKTQGFDVTIGSVNPKLFSFERDVVRWACLQGKAAIFAECGLGKTPMQLEWARLVCEYTQGHVLIAAPLAVADQTIREGEKFSVEVTYIRRQNEVDNPGIYITNYEILKHFDLSFFIGLVLDESSILKNYTGKTKQAIIAAARETEYKLACTATPAPNDHLELGNHADFLDIMPSNEMISRFFINDSMRAGGYRLKRHAEEDFYEWLTSWAVCLSKPKDLGDEYDMPGFDLPPLEIAEHVTAIPQETVARAQSNGRLLPDTNPSAMGMHKVKRESLSLRVAKAVEIVAKAEKPIVIWCETNYEADALAEVLPDAIDVRGDTPTEKKRASLLAFSEGEIDVLITKPSIAGFGMNWQNCATQIFVGATYSFEKTYQALRRSWRFGQTRPVTAHMIYAGSEAGIREALRAKEQAFMSMQNGANKAMRKNGLFREYERLNLGSAIDSSESGKYWAMLQGDCVERSKDIPDNSIGLSVFSPPFANLYIYSDSVADMGNATDYNEFFTHFDFLIDELLRVTMPGRLCVVHCKDLPTYINRDGAAGLSDFPGEIVRRFESKGWQYHSRVTIWKDPVIEMQRTKNHGLLHKNFVQRGAACRQGMPDYLVVFRKWADNMGEYREVEQYREIGDYVGTEPPTSTVPKKIPVWYKGTKENYDWSVAVWQRYASPVWFDIDQTRVLNFRMAKANEDEKHICPLQLDVIARSVDLWTNEGDVVFSPFAGIGSEGYVSLLFGRRFIGIELKPEYFNWAVKYLEEAELEIGQRTLWDSTATIPKNGKMMRTWVKDVNKLRYFEDLCGRWNIEDVDPADYTSLAAAISAIKEIAGVS